MTDIHGGGPAFPNPTNTLQGCPGISRRDYFAAAALTGILANPDWYKNGELRAVSESAFAYADAMLKERGNG